MAQAAGPLLTGGFMGLNIPARASSFAVSGHAAESPRGFAGSLGFRLSPSWRLAGEVSYTAPRSSHEGETQSRLALVNLYYDIDVGSPRFQPFLTIGAGLASDDFYRGGLNGLGLADDTTTTGVWQAGGGLNYQLNNDLALSGGYRHVSLTEDANNGFDSGKGGHELRMGVTWKLPVKRNRDGPGH